jgi:hypothetical protein
MNEGWELLYHSYPLARQDGSPRFSLDGVVDKTADGVVDVLIRDLTTGDIYLLTGSQSFELTTLPTP